METAELSHTTFDQRLCTAIEALDAGPRKLVRAGLSPSEVGRLVARVRAVSRLADAWIGALGTVAAQHAGSGEGPVLEEVLAGDDEVARSTITSDVGRVEVMARFNEVGSAIRNGSALPANVDALAGALSKVTPTEAEALAGFDGVLAERVSHAKPDSFRRHINRCIDRIRRDHGLDGAARSRAASHCRLTQRRDRSGYRVVLDLETERGTAVYNALGSERRSLQRRLGSDHGLTRDQLTAQAAHDLIVRGSGVDPDTHSCRPTVTVNVLTDRTTLAGGPHADTVSETFDGQQLVPATIGRLCCDATLRRLDTGPDIDVHAARTARTATADQRAALRALYPACPISGATWSHVEIHHVIEWEHGGQTKLDNLVPISSRWHHLVHEGGWTLRMDPDRTLHLSRPDGTHHRTIAPPHKPVLSQKAA